MTTPNPFIEKVLKEFDVLWNEHDGAHFYKDEFKDFIKHALAAAQEEGKKTEREKHEADFDNLEDSSWGKAFRMMCEEEGYRRAVEEVNKDIGFLRQWLNEKPTDRLVTNEDIRKFLTALSALQEKK